MFGFILWIVVGGVAGFIAERLLGEDHTIVMNVALGIGGSVVVNVVLWLLGYSGGNLLGQLVTGVVGAIALVLGYREYKRRS
ncbi:MAG: GlsB/YeaQ/YmgE family stress response membrane protein [Hyphomicrobiaceae bacterium]|nr:GlsB/YeaQ/YmgE family stress response membrane protein [Hyphomicrobiaceae bacterium]MCC0023438.1 GlsB/YeaQ/YmgE family stress response membrane protein [Hyphomicrobiaceae bacterium]